MKTKLISACLLMITFGCVDRVFFDIPVPDAYGISIGGFISDLPGPYRVSLFRTFDIESNDATKTGITATRVVISDNNGNSETLKQVDSGIYETATDGIQGKIGGVYQVTVELPDGRTYESLPDTLRTGGNVDRAYYELTSRYNVNGVQHLFDIYADVSTEVDLTTTHFMWINRTTHKSLTHPENEPFDPMGGGQCYMDAVEHKCNYKDPCSGLKNTGTNFSPKIVRVKDCECCFCWYDRYNEVVILNDKIGSVNGDYPAVRADRVPLTGWLLMYQARIEVSLQSLSPQAFEFWKGVRDQHTAVSNIFQPITGKIRGNMIQTAGNNEPAEGLFYATSISKKEFYIYRNDVDEGIIPTTKFPHSDDFSCLKLMPGATVTKPDFWIE